jgi:hypothetical protein
MHADDVFDSVTVPNSGAQHGLLGRTVFGQPTTVQPKDDGPARNVAVLALMQRLSAEIEASASDVALSVAFAPALWGRCTGREIATHTQVFDASPKLRNMGGGSTYGKTGSESLRGLKQTFRSPPAIEMKRLAQLQQVFLKQLEWAVVQSYYLILANYGNFADICPSSLQSVLIDGCVENRNELMNAPLCVGVSNTFDSLYAMRQLVFDPAAAVATLPELLDCAEPSW